MTVAVRMTGASTIWMSTIITSTVSNIPIKRRDLFGLPMKSYATHRVAAMMPTRP